MRKLEVYIYINLLKKGCFCYQWFGELAAPSTPSPSPQAGWFKCCTASMTRFHGQYHSLRLVSQTENLSLGVILQLQREQLAFLIF